MPTEQPVESLSAGSNTNVVQIVDEIFESDRTTSLHGLDGRSTRLGEAYISNTSTIGSISNRSEFDFSEIGAEIGRWLAHLHTSTVSSWIRPLSKDTEEILKGRRDQTSWQRRPYENLAMSFSKLNVEYGTQLAERINASYGHLLDGDDECQCHKQLKPPFIQLAPDDESGQVKIMVMEWRMTCRGSSAIDVGDFLAESWLLDCGQRELPFAFLKAYVSCRDDLNEKWWRRLGVHAGVLLGYWPPLKYPNDEQRAKAVVEIGAQILRKAEQGSGWLHLLGDSFSSLAPDAPEPWDWKKVVFSH